MIEFSRWMRAVQFPDRPWLMLGKGPSFTDRHRFDLTEFNLLALNHVAAEVRVNVAHIIDMDVAEDLGERLLTQCDWLLMPRHPHIDFRATILPLHGFFASVPALGELDQQGRLIVYDLDTTERPSQPPLIHVEFFSSVAALDLLGHMGVRTVRTLGVDGGRQYSAAFAHLRATTRLANRVPSFSLQAAELVRVAERHDMDVQRLAEPLRVYVGADPSQVIPAKVLEHTIHAFATRHVEVRYLLGLDTPEPRDRQNRGRTRFSFSRFHIPELAGYRGRALYLDSDMQVFGDITSLWDIAFDGAKVMCTNQPGVPGQWKDNEFFRSGRQMSVMMLDCERLPWNIGEVIDGLDGGRYTYSDLMFDLCLVAPDEITDDLPEAWNHLEHYEPGKTQLLHYTAVTTQPWRNDANPLRGLWENAFASAVREGAVTVEEVRAAIRRRHLKKGLLQIALDAAPTEAAPRAAILLELEALRFVVNSRPGRVTKVAKRLALAKVRGWLRSRR